MYGWLIGTHQRSIEWCHLRLLGYGLLFPKIGGLQLSYPLSQEQVKLRTSNLAGTFTGSTQVKPHQNLGENGVWAYPGTAQIF